MQKKNAKLTIISLILFFVVCPALILLCFSKNSFYLASVLVIVLAIVPFFVYFEKRRIKTSELVVVAMMTAVCAAGRMAFSFLPQVKPMAALVIVTAVAFGANVGFVVGAAAIFVSNFMFGQGVYTPFQMLAMGLIGFLSGLIFYPSLKRQNKIVVSLVGGLLAFFVYGFIVDSCSVLLGVTQPGQTAALSIYAAGLSFNIIHAVSTALLLFIIFKPMNDKFSRLRIKYGIFDSRLNYTNYSCED